jgi:hypothetical protein
MRVGLPEPACRSRFQTTSSCIGKEPMLGYKEKLGPGQWLLSHTFFILENVTLSDVFFNNSNKLKTVVYGKYCTLLRKTYLLSCTNCYQQPEEIK